MRPCDDTFGLVRGNRRKAVFAFKRAVSEGYLPVCASGQWVFTANFGSAGKIETCRAHSDFANKTAGRKSPKLGSGWQVSFFHRTSEFWALCPLLQMLQTLD